MSASAHSGAAAIFGCAGTEATLDERRFFRDADPWAFILFARNIGTPDQVSALVEDLRTAVGRNAPVLIDQEGGRVARLRGPVWREWPPVGDWCAAADDGRIDEETLWRLLTLRYRWIADELRLLGVDVCCAPLLDLPQPGADPIIGDRALGTAPETVAARGAAILDGLAAGGVLGAPKHMPGHGRADVDTHLALPRVDAPRTDLAAHDFAAFHPFRGEALGMTAHVVYAAVDPEQPATFSAPVIDSVIRGEIGFQGLLMTDDLSMGALDGTMGARASRSLAAGCDIVLHCNGAMAEMQEVAEAAPAFSAGAAARAAAALDARARLQPAEPLDRRRASEALERLSAPLTQSEAMGV